MKHSSVSILSLVFALCLGGQLFAQNEAVAREYWPTDDWKSRSPEQLGFDTTKLQAIDSFVRQALAATSSILVVRHGYVAYETYYVGDRYSPRRLISATKSVISILTGILVKTNQIQDIGDPMLSYLPELRSGNLADNVDKITIRNLLTMSSGLPDDGGLGEMSPKSLLSKPLASVPGQTFAYNGTNPNLLSMIITKLTNQTAAAFAEKELFKPLGIKSYRWNETLGFSNGALGLSLTTRDLAKIGYLYLNKGTWDTTEIVSENWVSESTSIQAKPVDQVTWKRYGSSNYGFLWWISPFKGAYFALGHDGQSITVMPDQDMVVVITTEVPYFEGGGETADQYWPIITDYIIPALRQ